MKTFIDLSREYLSVKRERQRLADKEKALIYDLIKLCKEKPRREGGYALARTIRRGNVDYPAIPELRGVDLDFYRKTNIVAWKLELDVDYWISRENNG